MNRTLETIARIFDVVAALALAGVVIWLGCWNYHEQCNVFLLIVFMLLGGVFSGAVCCAFHELGHVVFGVCCGFRFNCFHFGGLKIYRDGNKIRISAKKLPGSLAGSTEMIPKNAEKLHEKYLVVISGGLVFSLLFLSASAASLELYDHLPLAAYVFLCTPLPYAFHLFFYNVLPFNNDNMDTDGAMLKGLIKKEPSYLTAVNILTIEAYLNGGFTPAEMDKDLYFSLPQLPEDDLNFILLTSFRLMYYIDANDYPNAIKTSERLESVLEYVPKFYFNEISSDILFCDCFINHNKEKARQEYQTLKQYLKGEGTLQTHRISAAYELYVNSDKKAALAELSAAEEQAENYSITGLQKYERKLLNYIREDITVTIENP